MQNGFDLYEASHDFCKKNSLPYPLAPELYDPKLFTFEALSNELGFLAANSVVFSTSSQIADTLEKFNPSVMRDFPRATVLVPVTYSPRQALEFVRMFNSISILNKRLSTPVVGTFFFGKSSAYDLRSIETQKAILGVIDCGSDKPLPASYQPIANSNVKTDVFQTVTDKSRGFRHEIGLLVNLDKDKTAKDIAQEIQTNLNALKFLPEVDVKMVHFQRCGVDCATVRAMQSQLAPVLAEFRLRSTHDALYKGAHVQTISYSKGLRKVTGNNNDPFEHVFLTPDYAFSSTPKWPLERIMSLPETRALKETQLEDLIKSIRVAPLGTNGTLERKAGLTV